MGAKQATGRIKPTTAKHARPSRLVSIARGMLLGKFRDIRAGCLKLVEPNEEHLFGEARPGEAVIVLRVLDPEFYPDAVLGGSIGAAESYMRGHWECSDLTGLIRLMQRNEDVLDAVESGLARLGIAAAKGVHEMRRNTVAGSRRNIVAHYDLSNEFFALFLDPTMMYSSAVFEREDMTLEEASLAKIDRICRKLRLGPRDHLVEIGTGWGGFAVRAAQTCGCRVTTTTISDEQYALAAERIQAAGLQERITLLKQDYRELEGHFDKLVSIEMIEAVGHRFYPDYFRACGRLLKPDGMMALQAIIIDDRRYEKAKNTVDFIQRYIFPGSCIPSITAICEAVRDASDLRLFHQEDITPFYVRTLAEWRRNFLAAADRVRAMGFSEEFIRMWEFYLCYCEGGFAERRIGDVQMIFTKPECRCDPILGNLAHG